MRNICENCARRAEEAHQKGASAKQNTPARRRYGMRTDRSPIALNAFWGMHVEVMNWSGMGLAEYAALDLSPHALRRWRDRFEESGTEMDWRSLLHPSTRAQLSSAASYVRRKYRLMPGAADGRSNRRSFAEKQKRAIVAETERPGIAVALVCRHQHGIPLARRVRPDRPQGVATGDDWARRRHGG